MNSSWTTGQDDPRRTRFKRNKSLYYSLFVFSIVNTTRLFLLPHNFNNNRLVLVVVVVVGSGAYYCIQNKNYQPTNQLLEAKYWVQQQQQDAHPLLVSTRQQYGPLLVGCWGKRLSNAISWEEEEEELLLLLLLQFATCNAMLLLGWRFSEACDGDIIDYWNGPCQCLIVLCSFSCFNVVGLSSFLFFPFLLSTRFNQLSIKMDWLYRRVIIQLATTQHYSRVITDQQQSTMTNNWATIHSHPRDRLFI